MDREAGGGAVSGDPSPFSVQSDAFGPLVLGFNSSLSEKITFLGGLILDKDGFTYKGKRIDDAGEAHRVWMETMEGMRFPKISADSSLTPCDSRVTPL